MPAFSGSFTGTIRGQAMVSALDKPGHVLGLAAIGGTQSLVIGGKRKRQPKGARTEQEAWALLGVQNPRFETRRHQVVRTNRALGLFLPGTSPEIGGKLRSSLPVSDYGCLISLPAYSFTCANGICENNCRSMIMFSRRSN
jgi:hypothetical protein